MDRVKVESTHIDEIGYTDLTKTLEIKFKDGGIYQYAPVSVATHWRLMNNSPANGKSHGKFYARFIRGNKKYTGTKITESKLDRANDTDKFWVVSQTTGKLVDARNTEEAAWS